MEILIIFAILLRTFLRDSAAVLILSMIINFHLMDIFLERGASLQIFCLKTFKTDIFF